MPEEKPSPDAPPPLPAADHETAEASEEAKRLEKIRAAHSSHHVAGSTVRADLPKVNRDDGE